MVKASTKMCNVFVFYSDICHGMAVSLLQMLSCITLTFIFNFKHFLVMNLQLKLCNDSGCLRQIFLHSHGHSHGVALAYFDCLVV